MISMHNIEDTTSLNRISSDEDEYLESPLNIQKVQEIEQQSLQQCDEEVPISETPIERSFNRHIDERINDTAVLQNHANEITQKIMKNVKCAFQREIIKELVSKSKKRFKLDGFNLDLTCKQIITYADVTDSLIAMGFPAENFEAIYRNSMSEVQKFLNTRHPSNYMVINLLLPRCSERKYKHESFFKVAEFPFDDHQAPPFTLIVDFCTAVHDWLTQDPNHVIAVHCKAGKGRTGVMICCYLLYSGKYTSSQDALAYYGLVRTLNQKGVTIPSQIRYVHYFSFALKNDLIKRPFLQVELLSVRLVGSAHGSLIRLQNNSKQLIEKAQIISEKEIIFTFDGIYLQGDVLLQIFQKSIVSESKILQIWFNTNFVSLSPNEQVFKASEIDIMKKSKKKHSSNMQLELLLNKTVEIRQRSNCFSKGI